MLPRSYEPTGLVLIRATTDPGDLEPPPRFDQGAIEQEGRMWLAKVWGRPEVQEAVRFASRSLGTRIDQLVDQDGMARSKELRSAIMSVVSYLLRWQRRATPFGLFAGITTATTGPAAAAMGSDHRVVIRADAEWLTTLTDQLERHPGLRPRLIVVADNSRFVRDGRVIVHRRAEVAASSPGPLQESSVRFTQPVELALDMASASVSFTTLAARMASRFPAVSSGKIRALLDGLIDAGVLVTSLRAPMTTVDGLAHLVGALHAAGAEDLPEIAPLLNELDTINSLLTRHNGDGAPTREARDSIAERMTVLAPNARAVLAADVRLNATIAIPQEVLTEAALAASVLVRVTPEPFGSTTWLDYHARFRARYGVGALVPVRDLVGDSGLGYPTGYLGAPRARPSWRMLTDRDATLLTLIQQATLTGDPEISLTDADLTRLTVGEPSDVVLPPRVELGVVVNATSTAALDRGEFRLRVTAAPRTPTSMAGRFAHLLDDGDRSQLAAMCKAEDEVAAQLSFPPRRPHNENVVRVQPLLPHVVSLSEHPHCPDVTAIAVEDLAVTADAGQMYLVQRSTGRRVLPHLPHALDLRVQSPPLARFLAEVADARSAVFRGFDLGAARTLPYVPRIRYRRTVLAPARWRIATADVRGHSSFEDALAEWRRRWKVPGRVVGVHGELRLPLDLDQNLDRAVLRTHLKRAKQLELHEDDPPAKGSWIGRPAEFLIPLVAINQPARPLPTTAAPGTLRRPGGSDMLQAQLTGNPARFDDILATHLPQLIDNLGDQVKLWWARRHRDLIRPETDQHLAVVIRLTSRDHYGQAATTVAAFADELEARGLPCQLALASLPQHPRYGLGPVAALAEHVFATDTAAAIAQITAATAAGVPAQALAAASMTHMAAAFALDPTSGLQALIACLRQEHGPMDRALRDHTLKLADPTVRALPAGDALAAAWSARDEALTTYYSALAEQRDPRALLHTLLHDHHVRAIGVDPTIEQETGRLARTAALRRLALAGAL